MGCGSDYNKMIEIPPAIARQIQNQDNHIHELKATLSSFIGTSQGDPCYFCGGLCEPLSANPSRWPTIFIPSKLFGTGKHVQAHCGCLTKYIDELEKRNDQRQNEE
jgi:hypothetical protein